ncbi:hypothetical protein [Chromatocurvus halotolerans]|uniref:Peptidase M20/M25/M40-like protein n=1 Tax=Chromatocurvus halotolerans TaxID=1132028 RepID=A0A4R2KC56_9GAMM|nr:hypothetical protein [Chromatocurvus halotolerans]TCO71101.1 hypothetical protein EV688_12334 [Chromatocurvus halotolerans]
MPLSAVLHGFHSVWLRSAAVQSAARALLGGALLSLMGAGVTMAQDGASIARDFHRQHAPEIITDFADFLRLPNVASNLDDMAANARFIERYIAARGFTSRVVSAGGAPYVIAERPGSPGAPTVLIYAHFDGQPVVPDDWVSPPFAPTLWSAMPGSPRSAAQGSRPASLRSRVAPHGASRGR